MISYTPEKVNLVNTATMMGGSYCILPNTMAYIAPPLQTKSNC